MKHLASFVLVALVLHRLAQYLYYPQSNRLHTGREGREDRKVHDGAVQEGDEDHEGGEVLG